MHAIIRQGNGKYYISAVFAHYRDTASQYPDKTDWWVVWDAEEKKLIRQMNAVSLPTGIHLQVLIIDTDRHDWNMDERGIGCVDFLNKELLDSCWVVVNSRRNFWNNAAAWMMDLHTGNIPKSKRPRTLKI